MVACLRVICFGELIFQIIKVQNITKQKSGFRTIPFSHMPINAVKEARESTERGRDRAMMAIKIM